MVKLEVRALLSLPSFVHPSTRFYGWEGLLSSTRNFTHMMDALPGEIRSYVHTILHGIHGPDAKHLLPDIKAGDLFCQGHY